MKNTKLLWFFSSIILFMSLTSCSDDEDSTNNIEDYNHSIVGEWIQDMRSTIDTEQELFTVKFKDDGTWTGIMANASPSNGYYIPLYGTYKISGKKFTQATTMFGETTTSDYDIKKISKYDLLLYFTQGGVMDYSHRIVDTINLLVGETDEIVINDPDFIAVEYYSSNENVAKVDEAGVVNAIRAGTSYIYVTSSIGTAVVRIVVTTPKIYIDDYLTYIGENIDMATQAYGKLYTDEENVEENITNRHYYVLDDNISELIFMYNKLSRTICDVAVVMRDLSLVEKLTDIFSDLYEFRAEYKNKLIFQTTKFSRNVAVIIDKEDGYIQYGYEDANDPIAAMDALAHMTATEAAAVLKHVITEEERANGKYTVIVDNKIFEAVTINFDKQSDMISGVLLFDKEGTTSNDVVSWYQQHYIDTGNDPMILVQYNPLMYISFLEAGGGVVVSYMMM